MFLGMNNTRLERKNTDNSWFWKWVFTYLFTTVAFKVARNKQLYLWYLKKFTTSLEKDTSRLKRWQIVYYERLRSIIHFKVEKSKSFVQPYFWISWKFTIDLIQNNFFKKNEIRFTAVSRTKLCKTNEHLKKEQLLLWQKSFKNPEK